MTTLQERCRIAERCLPDAPYRAMLTNLHNEMLAALAQQPVSCIGKDPLCPCQDGDACHYKGEDAFPVPAPQAQSTSGDYALGYAEGFNDACKPAQPLTDEQIKSMWQQYCGYPGGILDFARAIEATHGIREVK